MNKTVVWKVWVEPNSLVDDRKHQSVDHRAEGKLNDATADATTDATADATATADSTADATT